MILAAPGAVLSCLARGAGLMRAGECWPEQRFSIFSSHGAQKLITKILQHTKIIFFAYLT